MFNQFDEVYKIRDLAGIVKDAARDIGLKADVRPSRTRGHRSSSRTPLRPR